MILNVWFLGLVVHEVLGHAIPLGDRWSDHAYPA